MNTSHPGLIRFGIVASILIIGAGLNLPAIGRLLFAAAGL